MLINVEYLTNIELVIEVKIISKFSNILRMIILLKSNGKMKVGELASNLEVDERMIRKYKDDLEKAGVYITSLSGTYGGYILEGYDYLMNLKLTVEEMSALELANEQLKSINFIYYKEFLQAFEKIKAVKTGRGEGFNKADFIVKEVKSSYVTDERQRCLDINAAIITRKKVKIKYFSLTSGLSERIVQPYAIVDYKGAIYFAAFCERRKGIINFKISRIREYTILNEKYEIPSSFSLREYLKNSFGIYKGELIKVKIKIEEPMSYIVSEKIWIDNQKISWNDDKSLIFEAETEGTVEIKSWVMSMGRLAEVLQPESLISDIKKELQDACEKY